jgi:hypothetical protein
LQHSRQGICGRQQMPESVTYVSGMTCYLCVGTVIGSIPDSQVEICAPEINFPTRAALAGLDLCQLNTI